MSSEEAESIREQAPPSIVRDMGITVLFILLTGGFLVVSGQFADERISSADPGAAFWPRAVLVLLMIAALLNLFLLYRRLHRSEESIGVSIPELGSFDLSEEQKKFVLAIVLSAIFFFSLEYLGFLIASPVFLFVFAYSIGYRDIGKLTVFSVVTALLIFFLFRNVMSIALPYGVGVFREISTYASNLL